MKFQWNANQAASNFRKHGISFDEGVTIFKDPLAFIFDDKEYSEDEHREMIIGFSTLIELLLVCLVERQEDIVRIFSARRATTLERMDYEENANFQTP